MKRIALLAIAWLTCSFASSQEVPFANKKVLFLGDSITHDGKYVSLVETELLLNLPKQSFTFLNCGLPSETVSGLSEVGHAGGKFPRPDLHERLVRVLDKIKPDIIVACYGMNDAIYLPLDEGRFQKFKDGIVRLREHAEKAGAKVIHLTPAVFDPLPIAKRVAPADKVDSSRPFADYNRVLDRYGAWLVEQRGKGWVVLDVHERMNEALKKARETNAAFTFAGDGVHPSPAGHAVLAQAVLSELKLPYNCTDAKFGDPFDSKTKRGSLFKLVHERNRILTAAWLSDTGHKRPLAAGLPLDQAKTKAAEIEAKIQAMR